MKIINIFTFISNYTKILIDGGFINGKNTNGKLFTRYTK